jgi:hypothetical protein
MPPPSPRPIVARIPVAVAKSALAGFVHLIGAEKTKTAPGRCCRVASSKSIVPKALTPKSSSGMSHALRLPGRECPTPQARSAWSRPSAVPDSTACRPHPRKTPGACCCPHHTFAAVRVEVRHRLRPEQSATSRHLRLDALACFEEGHNPFSRSPPMVAQALCLPWGANQASETSHDRSFAFR